MVKKGRVPVCAGTVLFDMIISLSCLFDVKQTAPLTSGYACLIKLPMAKGH
ncbi:TPA: hypothetical protein TVN69_000175 [Streptococcus equi subsp. zooepidemicus]|nr:hypothetical protein [Streptococcus equi subsp. zooepidemicus]HEL1229038.1 hypothetical protein [Streptococcus equi subsp. zooepidemicus]